MQGRYAADDTLLVRNRPFDGTYGYEVLVPFVDASGRDRARRPRLGA